MIKRRIDFHREVANTKTFGIPGMNKSPGKKKGRRRRRSRKGGRFRGAKDRTSPVSSPLKRARAPASGTRFAPAVRCLNRSTTPWRCLCRWLPRDGEGVYRLLCREDRGARSEEVEKGRALTGAKANLQNTRDHVKR